MGLCFEALHQDEMAVEAYRQAWDTLLNQGTAAADGDPSTAEEGAKTARPRGHQGADCELKIKDGEGQHRKTGDGGGTEIERILLKAKRMLANSSRSTSAVTARGWSPGSTPEQRVALQEVGARPNSERTARGPGTGDRRDMFAGSSSMRWNRVLHCREGRPGRPALGQNN